jgi:hypothetical protein
MPLLRAGGVNERGHPWAAAVSGKGRYQRPVSEVLLLVEVGLVLLVPVVPVVPEVVPVVPVLPDEVPWVAEVLPVEPEVVPVVPVEPAPQLEPPVVLPVLGLFDSIDDEPLEVADEPVEPLVLSVVSPVELHAARAMAIRPATRAPWKFRFIECSLCIYGWVPQSWERGGPHKIGAFRQGL